MNDLGKEIDWFRSEQRARQIAQRWADEHDRTAFVDYSPHYPLAKDRGGLYVVWYDPTPGELEDPNTFGIFDLDAAFGQRRMQVMFEPPRLRAKWQKPNARGPFYVARRDQWHGGGRMHPFSTLSDAIEHGQNLGKPFDVHNEAGAVVWSWDMRENSSGYYVWPIAAGKNTPLEGEGPYGPYALEQAKTFARIRATKGGHDYAVTKGSDPSTFSVERIYRRGTGERLSPNASFGQLPKVDHVEVWWDDKSTRRRGWTAVAYDEGGRPLVDSTKSRFPVGMDLFREEEAGKLLRSLQKAFPCASIDFVIDHLAPNGELIDARNRFPIRRARYDPTWGEVPDMRFEGKIGEAGTEYQFNIKLTNLGPVNIDEDDMNFEIERAFESLAEELQEKYNWIDSVFQTGRSGGWLVIEDGKGEASTGQLLEISKLVKKRRDEFIADLQDQYGYREPEE